jgi:biotin carboxylase
MIMNFIFISPNFPATYWNFCDRLHRNGVNVLAIGDADYNTLDPRLKWSLQEYYKVDSLENYDQVFRAVAFFSFKYGKIDWLESMNEYWLQQDARLRTDFNITTGLQKDQIEFVKEKALMKIKYQEGGIPTARQHRVSTLDAARQFIDKVGYPVIVKPNIGVGANDTFKLCDDKELEKFYREIPRVPYVMEEFIEGNIYSYDAIVDSKGDPLFESTTAWPPSIMDIVLKKLDLAYYVCAEVPENLKALGRRTVKSFGVTSRFVHLEFFRLNKARKGLGKKGDFVGLEVNMRPAGGYTPDMMNYAHSTDVYKIWADMVTYDKWNGRGAEKEQFCAYAGRRNEVRYIHTHEQIMEKYGHCMKMQETMPPLNWPQMGNYMYTAVLPDEEATKEFIAFVQTRAE